MNKYLTFLRGINVGGHNIIKMNDLQEIFISLGLTNVKTYIQSGNVKFESAESNVSLLKEKIENSLEKYLGNKVPVVIRTFQELQKIVESNIFADFQMESNIKLYICFLGQKPLKTYKLPLINEKDGIEVFQIINNDAFIVSRQIKGRTGFPNNFIEKELGVLSTARNLNTIEKIFKDNL